MLLPTEGTSKAAPATLATRDQEFRLGQWCVQPQLNRLQHRSGIERQLEPRLMHLLCLLAGNPDRVLTRDELVAEIWPRVIVNENSLTRAVSELRKQLLVAGQDNPVFIETIPKRGYRLLSSTLDAKAAMLSRRGARLGRATLLHWQQDSLSGSTAFSFALVLLIAAWLTLGEVPADSPQPIWQPVVLQDEVMHPEVPMYTGDMTLPTADSGAAELGTATTPVVSRDGNRFAYIEYDHLGSTIYLGNLEEMSEPVAVYFCDSYLYNLAWSPLGNALLFAQKPTMTNALYTNRGDTATLMQLDLDSYKASRLVGEDPANDSTASSTINLT
ncbi:MAG: winged helix-turn-helix domain-containing protein [Gammaproteobacteria bacterium]